MTKNEPYHIRVDVQPQYLQDQSSSSLSRYTFAYTINITNDGEHPAKLISRHWIITDGSGNSEEVKGEGVVGEHPHLQPGESFQYTSGTVLETPVGCMEGSYQMEADDGTTFNATIPAFTLSTPQALH
jgi:ApaG protein